MKHLVRAQNWLFRQIIIYPLRNAILILVLTALGGWGLFSHVAGQVGTGEHLVTHPLTGRLYPLVVVLALVNLWIAIRRHRRRQIAVRRETGPWPPGSFRKRRDREEIG